MVLTLAHVDLECGKQEDKNKQNAEDRPHEEEEQKVDNPLMLLLEHHIMFITSMSFNIILCMLASRVMHKSLLHMY